MAEPDLFEGEDDIREEVCDHAGHDWFVATDAADVCVQCGAMRTADAPAETGEEPS